MKLISIVTTCYNEEENVGPLAARVKEVFEHLKEYDYEHIFSDNCSQDNTMAVLKEMADKDHHIKIIANQKNFGQVRSVFNAIKAASGDAVILLVADLQDPPEMIAQFIQEWEKGYKVVFAIREKRQESYFMTALRRVYYRLLKNLSEDELVNDAGEFCLFDKAVLDIMKQVKDTNPYIRGLIMSLGYEWTGINYHMEKRHKGRSTANLAGLFFYALNGFIHHTMFPLRMASVIGILLSFVCFGVAFIQLILKLIFWADAPAGLPTLTVGLFFLSGVQLFLIGYLGEIVSSLYQDSKNLPLVVEKERVNFNDDHK
ncbi:MAG: glycosyltransferase family 2 protein [Deltaproteobacteria bacterium]|nr:glycosyltransferase family 2 protein [Deltaproteobacteria bacterium]